LFSSPLLSPDSLLAREAKLTILFTNDHHGQVETVSESDPSKPIGGVTRRMALIEKIRQEVGPKSVLLVDGGDLFTGTALSGLTNGEVDCAAYQLMKYDAIVLGNHDFDYGKKSILEFQKKFAIPWVSANAVVRLNSQNFVRPYVLKYAGVRVGMIGFSNPTTPQLTRRENVSGLIFNPPGASAKGLHSILKKDADLFIALSHLGVDEDKKFAKDNPFLQIIIGGHTHTLLLEPIVDKRKDGSLAGPLITQAGSRGLYLGRLDLTLEGHRDPKTRKEEYHIADYHYQLIPITANLPEDPSMVELLEKYKAKFKAQGLDDTLVTVMEDFSRSEKGDSMLGEITADAIRTAAHAEVALVNSGAFRSDLHAGSLTRSDLYELYPFDDAVVVLDIPGIYLRKAIEASWQKKGEGAFLQVSGMKIDAKGGSLKIQVGTEPLSDRRKYRVAVNDFLSEGGDGYDLFRRIKSRKKTTLMARDLLEEALKTKQKISSGNL
ncbi:MAG TPA: bifunctional UDP-sugar hydrolase/5'-nucleotidase, partial [bacterium]